MPELDTPEKPIEIDAGGKPAGEAEPDDAAELATLAVDDGKGGKMVPLSALIASKKEARALGKKVKELEPVAARVTEVDDRLNRTAPIVNAILNNPKLSAEVTRMTRTSQPGTEQPAPEDDTDAHDYADAQQWYVSDTGELDLKRARRALDIVGKQSKRQFDEGIRPLAGLTMGSRADQNIARAVAMHDADGAPYATEQSIREVANKLPAHLLASDDVVQLVLRAAIGEDRMQGRTPKALEEPLYLEHAGGRGRRPDVLTGDDRRVMEKLGLSEKDLQDAETRMTRTRGGTRLE